MDYLARWRGRLQDALRAFAVVENDPGVSLQYGVLAGGALWAVRDDAASAELQAALSSISAGADLAPLSAFLRHLNDAGPLRVARELTELAGRDQAGREVLDRIVLYFLDDYLRLGLLRDATGSVTVQGNVTGANVVIGGHQYIGGDLVIAPARAWSCPAAPNPPPHFAGRRGELDQLQAALAGGRSVAVTGVHGMGGIGKTALVLQAAAAVTGFGAVLWASLGPDPAVVNHLVGWARHGDQGFEVGDSPLEVLAARVNSVLTQLVRDHCPGRVLVILDDVWEGDSVAAARVLQRAAPSGATYLITTRSQRVVAQLRSSRLELGPLLPADALQMLRNLLIGFPEMSDANLTALAEVVGYHPLALELAAGQVQLRERPAAEIEDLIEIYRRGVPAGSPFGQIDLELGETREDNLEVVLAYSYESLSAANRADFRALGILAYGAPFHRDTCAAIWGRDAIPALDALRHRAMLSISADPGWYQQHQLLRAYARALLDLEQAERAAVSHRYAEHIVGLTGQFAELPAIRWRPLEPVLPHVEEVGTILVAATAGQPDAATEALGLTFAVNAHYLLARRRELRHAEWLEMGLTIARKQLDLGYVSLFLNELGQDELFHGQQQRAIQRLAEASNISERTGDRPRLAVSYVRLGTFYLSSDPENVPRYLQQAIGLYEELGDAAGVVTALLVLAQWHMTLSAKYEQRKDGEAVLLRAIEVASSTGNEEGAAEARLQLGRLYDTLGRRDEAVPLLSETTGQLQQMGRTDLAALGHLFTASAAAALGDLGYAETCLRTAIPLFRTTGHGPGQATALRNLAELRAGQGEAAAALELFSDALPLVRRVTMHFLDTDYGDPQFAVPFFSAQYEDVVKLDLVEAFRSKVAEESDWSPGPVRGWIAEECVFYLLRETARVAKADSSARTSWLSALRSLKARFEALAPSFDDEKAFVDALDLLLSGQRPELDESNVYRSRIDYLSARMDDERARRGQSLIDDETVSQYVSNTLAAKLFQPEHARDWAIQLRRQRRGSADWGDDAERAFYQALLGVLAGRPVALRPGNPYLPHLGELLARQKDYEVLPLMWLLRETVVAAQDPAQRPAWLEWLHDAVAEAAALGSPDEADLLRALTSLTLGEAPRLPPDHAFHSAAEQARGAITVGQPLIVPLPPAVVAYLVMNVVEARTTKPKNIDVIMTEIADRRAEAVRVRDDWAHAFCDALSAILAGETAELPADSPYAGAIARTVVEVSDATAASPGSSQLPAKRVDLLATAATEAAGPGPRSSAASCLLESHRDRFAARGQGWEAETAFAEALLAIAAGRQPSLAKDNPYAPEARKAAVTIARHKQIRQVGGRLDPALVDELLRRTGEQFTGVRSFMEQFGTDKMLDMLYNSEFASLVSAQREWATALGQQQAEFAANDAQPEAAFFAALVAITDTQPVRLPRDNPYYAAVHELMADIDYAPGVPDMQLSALASDPDTHVEEFRAVFSGRNIVTSQLDDLLVHTVMARTLLPDSLESSKEHFSRLREHLADPTRDARIQVAQLEADLLDALMAVLDGRAPTLPPDHAYRPHLENVEKAIAVFHFSAPEGETLSGDLIAYLCWGTGSALGAAPEQRAEWRGTVGELRLAADDRWSADAISFLDALLIVMDGRPADLPIDNPYRPFLLLIPQIFRASSAQ